MANVSPSVSSAPNLRDEQSGGLTDVIDDISRSINRESAQQGVKLGVLLSAVGRRSYGPLLLVTGLFAISPATIVPGMTSLTAILILLIASQMAIGLKRPWLPRRILEIRVPRRSLRDFLDKARQKIERLDGVWLRPRLSFLSQQPFVNLVALCVVAAALITIPLSLIPFAPLAPGLAIVLFGLGMTARDGLWLSAGVALTAAAFLIAAPLIF